MVNYNDYMTGKRLAYTKILLIDKDIYSILALKTVIEITLIKNIFNTANSVSDLLTKNKDEHILFFYRLYSPECFYDFNILTKYIAMDDVVVIVSRPTLPIICLLMSMGAKKIISDKDLIIEYIYMIKTSSRHKYISPVITEIMKKHGEKDAINTNHLTPMECSILGCILKGVSCSDLAKRKKVNIKTVINHKNNALKKIRARKLSDFFIIH